MCGAYAGGDAGGGARDDADDGVRAGAAGRGVGEFGSGSGGSVARVPRVDAASERHRVRRHVADPRLPVLPPAHGEVEVDVAPLLVRLRARLGLLLPREPRRVLLVEPPVRALQLPRRLN